ncbi:MAG: PA2779 family protein [Gammaproteobacteria bacterium]|nr:PA2779 family protein [Gammaproteobacteria bacterium]
MNLKIFRACLVRLLSVAMVSAGFAQFSFAGVVGTDYLVEADARTASLTRIETFLARDDVAQQLRAFGVDEANIEARLAGLTSAELQALEGRIHEHTAGGDVLGLIGAVFLVLLILEIVGVTDIFKSV